MASRRSDGVVGAAGQIHLVGAMFNNAAAPRARARARGNGRASACVQCVHLAPRPLARPTIYVRRSPPTSSIFISTEGRAVCPGKDGGRGRRRAAKRREGRERERQRRRGGGGAAVLHPETRRQTLAPPSPASPSSLAAFYLPGYPPPTPTPSPS